MSNLNLENIKLCATQGVNQHIEYGLDYASLLARFSKKDWGDLADDDKAENDLALENKGRILAAYQVSTDLKIWIILDRGHKVLTLLLPSEY